MENLMRVLRHLAGVPAYVFSAVVALGLLSRAAGELGALAWLPYPVVALVCLATVFIVERASVKRLQVDSSPELRELVEDMAAGWRNSSRFAPLFWRRELAHLGPRLKGWARGQFDSHQAADNIVSDVYEFAHATIRATCVPEYLAVLDSEFGKKLREVQRRSCAESTRVFLFRDRGQLTDDRKRIIREHLSGTRITGLIYFSDGQDEGFCFPPDPQNDFVLVDDEVVGATYQFDGKLSRAHWHVGDTETVSSYAKKFSVIVTKSDPAQAYIDGLE